MAQLVALPNLRNARREELLRIIKQQQFELGGNEASGKTAGLWGIVIAVVAWIVLLVNTIYIGNIAFRGNQNLSPGVTARGATVMFWINLIILLILTGLVIFRAFSLYKGKSFKQYSF